MAEEKMSLEEARRICLAEELRSFAEGQFFTDEELEKAAARTIASHQGIKRIWDCDRLYSLLCDAYYCAVEIVEGTDPARSLLNLIIDSTVNDWDELRARLCGYENAARASDMFPDVDWEYWSVDLLPALKAKIDLDDPFAPTGTLKTADGTACRCGLIVYSADGERLEIDDLDAASGKASTRPAGEGADGVSTWHKCCQLYRSNPASLKALREERLEKERSARERWEDRWTSEKADALIKALADDEGFRDEVTDRIVNGKGYANIACPGGQAAWTKALASDEGAAAVRAWKRKDVHFKLFTAGGVPTLTMHVEGCGEIAPYTDVIDPAGAQSLD